MSWQQDRGRTAGREALIDALKRQHGEVVQEIARIRERMHNSWGEPVSVIKGLQDLADQYFAKESKIRKELAKNGVEVNKP